MNHNIRFGDFLRWNPIGGEPSPLDLVVQWIKWYCGNSPWHSVNDQWAAGMVVAATQFHDDPDGMVLVFDRPELADDDTARLVTAALMFFYIDMLGAAGDQDRRVVADIVSDSGCADEHHRVVLMELVAIAEQAESWLSRPDRDDDTALKRLHNLMNHSPLPLWEVLVTGSTVLGHIWADQPGLRTAALRRIFRERQEPQ